LKLLKIKRLSTNIYIILDISIIVASTILINLIFTAIISIMAYLKYLSAKKDIYKYFAIGFALFSIPYLFTVLRISFYGRSEVDLIINIIGYIAIIYGLMNR
jgi:hypothetical protein